MPSPTRSSAALDAPPRLAPLLAVSMASLLAACASGAEPARCAGDDQCPSASRCVSGSCSADERPIAAVRAPAEVEEFALVQLDGSGSADPDRGDSVVEHVWTVRPISAACEPPVVAGTGPVAMVRFGCPGRFAVDLAVRDAAGLESEPASVEIEVAPATHPAGVLAGADVVSDHECAGDPLVCRTASDIRLSSSAMAAGITVRWSVEPPAGRPLDGTRRVAFSPGPDVASPGVSIETDGTAIAGDWIFRVEARDPYGVIGAAHMRVSVANRAPVVLAEPPAPFPHAFDPRRSLFTCSGEIPFLAYDPDGDPVEVAAVFRHVGDGGARFGGALLEDRAAFSIEVPRAVPADALHLVGGTDLERSLEIVARDANHAEGWAALPVVVGNRPPAPAAPAAEFRVPHAFDPVRSRYVAVAPLGEWSDPDGDPLTASGGAAPCDSVSVVDGAARVECAVPYAGSPAVNRISGAHVVPLRVADPWIEGPPAMHAIEVLDSPPELAVALDGTTLACANRMLFRFCPASMSFQMHLAAAQFWASPTVSDPDGDPVMVTPVVPYGGSATPSLAVCTSAACPPFRFELPDLLNVCPIENPPARLRASDGAAEIEVSATPPITGC